MLICAHTLITEGKHDGSLQCRIVQLFLLSLFFPLLFLLLSRLLASPLVPLSPYLTSPLPSPPLFRVLSQLPDLDPSIINALSAACTIGAEEALSASNCSGYALTSLLSNTEQGMFFPNGG